MAQALIRAFVSLLHPRMLVLMAWPVLAAIGIWIVLAFLFWSQLAVWIGTLLRDYPLVEWAFSIWPLALAAAHIGWVVLALAFVPLVLVTTVIIIGFAAMPAMVEHVAARNYPDLARRRGGTMAGSVWNGVMALVWFAVLAIVTLPAWLVPPLWPLLPLVLFGYLNQRVFRYDALAEHASGAELSEIVRRERGAFLALGAIVALFGHVPVLGFFSPLWGGLAFIHYGLARLEKLRREPVEGVAVRMIE